MKKIILSLLTFFKKYITPPLVFMVGHACRFTPTCSEYAHEAINKYGVLKGGGMAVKRILRCNPFTKPGYDPVA